MEASTVHSRRDWFKSNFSRTDRDCVLVRFVAGEAHVRDGKNLDGPVLVFTRSEWDAFELGVFHGEFAFPLGD
ncbi:DUF397 domain-containing protein [Nocardia alni]|uniref:DUF397 domain-containing protein n=1 Tax=Nocardia alni TaxID=2815723 RepID=UPI001C241951|nr:DUF397 domain-containing protein [Nocardia alni]